MFCIVPKPQDWRTAYAKYLDANGAPAKAPWWKQSLEVDRLKVGLLVDELIIMGNYPGIHPYELGMLAGNPNVREITTKINSSITRTIFKPIALEENKKIAYTNATS